MKTQELNTAMQKYDQLRTKRLGLEKQAAELKAEEDMLRDMVKHELMARLDQDGTLYQPPGMKVKAELKMRAEAVVYDWTEVQKYIIATGSFDLLQKRVTVTAVRQRWEVGQEVPGIKQEQVFDVTISKVKE